MRHPHRAHRRALVLTACAAAVIGVTAATTAPSAVAVSAPNAAGMALISSPVPALAAITADVVDTLSTADEDAEAALDAGERTKDAAAVLSRELAASALDLGRDATLDTDALDAALERLDTADIVPMTLFPELTDEVVTHTRAVAARTADLRGALDAARAQRAADEAAAEAAAEAQREAEAAAAALARANTPEGAQATARTMAAERYGWGDDQFSCLASLWQKESNWNYQAFNASSGATGIPQSLPGSKMASAGADWQANAATQIAWGLDYIDRAYGAPCAAWGHSQAVDWY